MYLARSRVNGDILKIRIYGKSLKYRLKYAHPFLFAETAVDSLPRSISLWKFSPRCPSSSNPQYPIHHTAVITFCRTSTFPFLRVFWRQYVLDSVPLTVCEFISLRSHMLSLHHLKQLCNSYFSNKP